jgi:hypothetical protein
VVQRDTTEDITVGEFGGEYLPVAEVIVRLGGGTLGGERW